MPSVMRIYSSHLNTGVHVHGPQKAFKARSFYVLLLDSTETCTGLSIGRFNGLNIYRMQISYHVTPVLSI